MSRRAGSGAGPRLGEVAGVFMRLGFLAFGGPAVHVALMREQVVDRRRWLEPQEFVDALGATSALPGPGSTQMAMYLGRRRAGWAGLLVAGACFIGPATGLVLAMAWAYVRYGHSEVGTGLLYGVKPVVVAVVALAIWRLARSAVRDPAEAVVAAAALGLFLVGVQVLVVLAGAAVLVSLWRRRDRLAGLEPPGGSLALLALGPPRGRHAGLAPLFLKFLELGSVVFGGGYVLLAFLRTDLVQGLHWLTNAQLIDAVAAGQLTPGPVFTTATFVGYLVHGTAGALAATAGIFLPSFAMVAFLAPLLPRIRRWAWAGHALDGMNAAAIGLLTGVTVTLGHQAVIDPVTGAIAVVTLAVLVRTGLNSAWLILAGAAIGVVRALA